MVGQPITCLQAVICLVQFQLKKLPEHRRGADNLEVDGSDPSRLAEYRSSTVSGSKDQYFVNSNSGSGRRRSATQVSTFFFQVTVSGSRTNAGKFNSFY